MLFLSHYRLFFFVLPIFPSTYGEHQNIKKTVISTTIFCLFVILLVFIVPCSASVKEKTEIKNMKTNVTHGPSSPLHHIYCIYYVMYRDSDKSTRTNSGREGGDVSRERDIKIK